ncbi:MAG: M36 family metallopeptidase, partial [Pyrinomonadaceae bacterium]
TILIVVPSQFRPAASVKKGDGLFTRTKSADDGLPKMWDIRDEGKSNESPDALVKFRQSAGKDASSVADLRDGFVRGEAELVARLPHAKVEYNNDIRIPEVITPDVYNSKIEFLSAPSTLKRAEILRNFVKENDSLVGINQNQANALKVVADYTNPSGNMSYAHLEQRINDIPVFRGEVKAGFTADGRIVRVINNLAPGLDYESLSKNFRNPADAVIKAAAHINHELKPADVSKNDGASTDNVVVFGQGDWATTAERMYFPTEPGVAVPAWRVLIWQPVNAYYVIVDAANGIVLWHKNISEDQTQSGTYQVYTNPAAYIGLAESPAPLTPGPLDPSVTTQGSLLTRTNVTLVGNEVPYTFNNNGWITDGANITDGNSLEAGIDRDGTNGVDAPQTGAPNRTFTSLWNPAPGSPGPGDDPLTVEAQRGAVVQMFYVMNRYHDELYRLGFTEQARNFQASNFGRGGVENDRVSAEGQDSSGTNNANFSTGADGTRGRMQMFIWTGPTPDKDGTADGDIVIHEVTHGTSNRLHGNGSGLGGMGGMMGEGWSDWYGHTLLAEPSDPVNGIYTTGGYATHLLGGSASNFYYGIRRWPKAVIASTGGPNRVACGNAPCPHNPFTFKHINADCDTTLGTSAAAVSSAFPRSSVIATSGSCNQVHNAGEVWSSLLWEVRALMIARLGFTAGTQRVLQVVTDGMKLAPLNPTFVQERNAIIAAAAALPVAPEASLDVIDVREGFRRRGMGFSASVQSVSAVTEAFDFPNIAVVDPFTVSDSTGDNDGFPEPGENVLLSVSITNTTGAPITGVQANVNGGTNVSYGTINDGQTVAMNIPYTIPGGAACGSLHQVTINASSSAGAQTPVVKEFRLGAPVGGAPATFTGGAIANPGTGTTGVAAPYPSTVNVTGLSGAKKIKFELTGLNTTYPGDMDWLLVGPGGQKFIVMSDALSSFTTQTSANVVFTDSATAIIPATGANNLTGEWKPTDHTAGDTFAGPAPAGPYQSPGPVGAATFASVFGIDGAAMNGTWSLYGVDDASGDIATITGWKLTFESNEYVCSLVNVKSRADFDGDGKTDLSVFRPSEGNWYLNRSTAGFAVINWGTSTDSLIPGDFDNDGKADTAVFRPSADPAQPDFYILNSNGFTVSGVSWGTTADVAVTADYDGDGKADPAVFRPSSNTWYVLKSTGGFTSDVFGQAGDVPMAMDTNADGKAQITVYRSSNNTWYIARPTGVPATNFDAIPFGMVGDHLVPADYDGDNKDDVAVYRPSNGTWYVLKSTGGTSIIPFGISTDVPVPGDYDGDGSDDVAVYRNGNWFVQRSTSGLLVQPFGISTDTPIPARYVP